MRIFTFLSVGDSKSWHIILLFLADIGVYGMVEPDIFQGRDETIRQEMKANLLFIFLLNICTVISSAVITVIRPVSHLNAVTDT